MLGGQAELNLPSPVEPSHRLGELGPRGKMPGIDLRARSRELSAPRQGLVREPDHAEVRPSPRPDLEQPREDASGWLVRVDLSEQHRHRGGRARDAHVAVDEEMTFATVSRVLGERAPEAQDRVDVLALGQHDVGRGLDGIMEVQGRAVVGIVGPERLRLGPVRIEDGQDVRDRAGAVVVELLEAADREERDRERLRGRAPSTPYL